MIRLSQKAQKVYDCLQDEESRKLFQCRYAYYLDGDREHLWDELKLHYQYHPNHFTRWLANYHGEEVVVFAAGSNARGLFEVFSRYGIICTAICDSDVSKQGKDFYGLTIVSPQILISKHKKATIIVTTQYTHVSKEILVYLESHGRKNDAILFTESDEKQYFPNFIKPLSEEVFIDGGTCDGESSIDFYQFAVNAKSIKVYAFEPSPQYYRDTLATFNKHHIEAQLFQLALWHEKDTLHFQQNLDNRGGSHITMSGDMDVKADCLDNIVPKEEKITFIKMDIEGSEWNALKGAAGHIKRNSPRLAICVYHKREDIIEIPEFILSINPSYKLYLRHHAPFTNLETVLYAIPTHTERGVFYE